MDYIYDFLNKRVEDIISYIRPIKIIRTLKNAIYLILNFFVNENVIIC